ncbi:MAG: beta-ketoacyl-ACP synthase III [Brevinemataceae bacterium]
MNIGITGFGIFVPEKIVTNHELSKTVDTNDEWIVQRTGIKKRHIAQNQTTSEMAVNASVEALKNAGIDSLEIDFVICSTGTPEYRFPSTAAVVQDELNIPPCPSFDMSPACGGFVYVLSAAEAYIKSGFAKKVLCICSERMSSIVDWSDRNTCVLFGDAAAAFVVEADSPKTQILQTIIGGDGAYKFLLYTEEVDHQFYLRMDGSAVFKHALKVMEQQVREVCAKAGKKIEDIDLLVPHQANIRIIEGVAKRLDLPLEKAFINVDQYANTSSATIPLALYDAEMQGIIQPGMLVAVAAIGGGFTWGASLIQY